MESPHPLSYIEGGYSDDGFWRPVHHFNYTYLRNAFRTALLDEMGRRLGSSFKKIKSQCYTNHKKAFTFMQNQTSVTLKQS